jgi:AcrR family transcriptional regulator
MKALETREKIFRMAFELFEKKGFENVKIEDICGKLGLSTGAFYNHFRSKDQIIIEQFKIVDEYNLNQMAVSIAGLKTTRGKLLTWSAMNVQYLSSMGKSLVKVAYRSQIGLDKKFSFLIDEKRPMYTVIEKVLSEGQKAGEIRTDISARELTHSIARAYRGVIYDWCLAGSKFDLETAWQEMDNMISSGIIQQ